MSDITPITMPKFGLAMTEGKIVSWSKQEGSEIAVGEELADIETSKVTNAYASPVRGVLRRHVVAEQEALPIGALIAVVADASVPESEIDAFIAKFQGEFAGNRDDFRSKTAVAPVCVEAGGRAIRYLEAGTQHQGRPVVLIHGFGGDLNNWLFTQPSLAETHRVIALDLPGHGGSSKDVGSGDLTTLSRTLSAFLDVLDISQAHLVGHSLGGAVALRIALDGPARIASLSLICPTGLGKEIDGAFMRDFITAGRRKQLLPVLEKLFADKSLVSTAMAEDLLKFKRIDGAQSSLAMIATANFGEGRQEEVLVGRLAELGSLPVQVIWGQEDQIIPAWHAAALPENVKTHMLPGAGHMPHLENAAEVNRILLDFIIA